MEKKHLIVVLGPTASGKTNLSIELAKHYRTEIISADSRQFFKETEIGTAKPSATQLTEVKHHFINSLSIQDEYNVGMFERDALNILDDIFKKNDIAIMAGGSGLYIQAVCNGFDDVPQANAKIRNELTETFKKEGIVYLQEKLKKLDEKHFQNCDIKNPHRLIRAIEVCMTTGKAYSELRKGKKKERNFQTIFIGLDIERETLYERINNRVDQMMSEGLVDEVQSIKINIPNAENLNSLHTVGYKELFDYLNGKTDLSRAVELIKQNTRNFAKRQMTWFRKNEKIKWLEPTDTNSILTYIKDNIG